jgi:nitrite reductase/ring-hydroxylating ferredoxin subunit
VSEEGWYDVAAVDDVDDDDVVCVLAGTLAFALYRVDGTFYATADRCTHEEASLSDGWLQDRTIECPRHQGVFDIVSGKALRAPATVPVATFPVRVEGHRVFIRVE